MKTAGRKPNIVLYVAGILLLLTVLSLYVTTGLYAKYLSSSSTQDSAHTAAFYIEAKGSLLTHSFQIENVVPGETIEEEVQIINKSEVKVQYTLTIQNETNNLPVIFVFTNVDTHEEFTSTDGKCTVTKSLDPGETIDHYVLSVIWETSDSAEDANLPYMGMIDQIVVTLEAVQID